MMFLEDAMDGIKSPLDYNYVKLLRIILKSVFFWPGELLGETHSKYWAYKGIYPIVFNGLVLSSNIAYLVTHAKELNFLVKGHMYLTIFLTTLSFSRSVILPLNTKYNHILVYYLKTVHLFYHAHKSEYAMAMHIRMHKVCHVAGIFIFVQMIGGLSLFNIIPAYLNYATGKLNYKVLENTTYEHSVFLYYPRDATTNRDSYYFLATFNWFASYQCSCIICMVDLLLFVMVFHVYGHFKILLNLVATFPRPANNDMYTERECKEIVSAKLKECIEYHKFLLEFTNNMSSTFGLMLFIYFAFHQVSCCLLLLECSEMSTEALIRYGPLTVIVFEELIQISVIFEIIGTVSEKLKDAVYDMPWECMDIKNQKVVMFFLMNVQNPIHVKVLGIIDVGVVTMSKIVKTSVSYFAFLRTVPS